MSRRRSHATTVRIGVGVAMLAAATTFLVGSTTTPAFASGPALVQKGSVVTSATTTVTLTLSSASTAGNLLIATLSGYGNSNNASGPAGWTSAVQTSGGGTRRTAIFYYANNPGSISSAVFTFGAGTTFIAGQISEWSGMSTSSPLDFTNRNNNASGLTFNLTSGGATTVEANEIAVTVFQEDFSSATTVNFTPGGGWTNFGNTGATSGTTQYTADYETGLASGASPSETETSSVSATVGWLGAIATFGPPATCTGGSLTLGQPNGGVQFNGINLNGTDRTDNAQPTWTPSDQTGSNAGWNIQLTSTQFTTGTHTLSTTATTATSASRSSTVGTCTLPTNSVTYPITVPAGAGPPTAVKIYNAAANTGEGVSSINFNFNIAILADYYSGTYNSTWTVTIASGP
jgi:hypothetical protein